MINLNLITPEIFISVSIMTLLMIGVFLKKSEKIVYNLSILTLIVLLTLCINIFQLPNNSIFSDSYQIDKLSSFMKIIMILSGIFVLLSSSDYLNLNKLFKIEYPILFVSSILGMMVMISSNDLIVFYIGLELQSLALYVLATFNRNNILSAESGLKYFVLSALSSGLLLYGCSLVYGFSGTTNFNVINTLPKNEITGITFGIVFIIVGLAFKVSAVPFHMWAPDVYQGSPTSVTMFLSIPKIAAITVIIRFLYIPFYNLINQWQMIIIFLSIASMIFGSVAAIGQKNLKRLIAYSSIGHMGYALAGLASGTNEGVQSSVIYIAIYLIMNLAFLVILMFKKMMNILKKSKIYQAFKKSPLLSFSLLIILFSLAGIPPLAGFLKILCIYIVINQKLYALNNDY